MQLDHRELALNRWYVAERTVLRDRFSWSMAKLGVFKAFAGAVILAKYQGGWTRDSGWMIGV